MVKHWIVEAKGVAHIEMSLLVHIFEKMWYQLTGINSNRLKLTNNSVFVSCIWEEGVLTNFWETLRKLKKKPKDIKWLFTLQEIQKNSEISKLDYSLKHPSKFK